MISKCPFCKAKLNIKTEKSGKNIYKKMQCFNCIIDSHQLKFSLFTLNNKGYDLQLYVKENFRLTHYLNPRCISQPDDSEQLLVELNGKTNKYYPPGEIYVKSDIIDFYRSWIEKQEKLKEFI
jgi:hypothetical protein